MNDMLKTCPLCGNPLEKCKIDETNLAFLVEMAKEERLSDAISLARVVWQNLPQLRHAMDSELIKELSRNTLENVQERINHVLEPMKVFIEKYQSPFLWLAFCALLKTQ